MATMTQSDRVFRYVRNHILEGTYTPGSKLKLNDLVQSCNVSLGAVREALSRLSADGFVVPESQKGYRVAEISPEELIDLTNVRVSIEGLCLCASIERGDIEWETGIVAAYHRLSRLSEPSDEDPLRVNENWSIAHGEFHYRLVCACASPTLLRIRDQLYAQAERYRRLSLPLKTSLRDVDGEHKAIMEATLARKPEEACELMNRHLHKTSRILLESHLFSNFTQSADKKREPVG